MSGMKSWPKKCTLMGCRLPEVPGHHHHYYRGHLDVFAESYACLKLSDEHLAEALALPYPRPEYVIHGPGAAEIRGRIFEAGLQPVQGAPRVDESIKGVERMLTILGDAMVGGNIIRHKGFVVATLPKTDGG